MCYKIFWSLVEKKQNKQGCISQLLKWATDTHWFQITVGGGGEIYNSGSITVSLFFFLHTFRKSNLWLGTKIGNNPIDSYVMCSMACQTIVKTIKPHSTHRLFVIVNICLIIASLKKKDYSYLALKSLGKKKYLWWATYGSRRNFFKYMKTEYKFTS